MNEAVLKQSGIQVLIENFGYVEAERFISLIKKEPVDYTEWRKKHYKGMTVEDIFARGQALEQ
jgi:hypothetical protein